MPRLRTTLSGALLALLLAVPGASGSGEQPAPPAVPTTPPTTFSKDRVIVEWTAAADPLFGQLWGLRNLGLGIDGFPGAVAGDDIAVTSAWDRTVGTPSTVIADIDSGYRFEHPDLGPVAWTNPGEIAGNGVDDDGNGLTDDTRGYDFVGASSLSPTKDNDPTDDNLISGGHGVHTAGTIGAAGNNGVGISGVARNVRIMPLRVCANNPTKNEASCPFSSILQAINYAGKMGARAVNMSLGGNVYSQTEVDAIASFPQTLFVISAGNDNGDNDGGGVAPKGHHYPCDYRPTVDASPAGPVDNIVCVAATTQADGLAGFSDWGATSVDIGAPGTETLSTYPYRQVIDDSFEANDFGSKWLATGTNGGFLRSNELPLTSFGMTDSPGAAPAASTVRTSTSAPSSIPAGLKRCELLQSRVVSPGSGGSYEYSVLQDSSLLTFFATGASSSGRFRFEIGSGGNGLVAGGSVQVRFSYLAGSPSAGNGVWLDDIELRCAEPVGLGSSYGFLQGTSMAAPHVTGAAALLFSLKPSATVTQVRNALLSSVDPAASLSGKTTTGGRLDVAAALNQLVPVGTETVAPDTAILSGPEGTTASTSASFQFARTDADSGAFECKLDAAAFVPCTSPAAFTVAPGSHQLQVRAKVPSGLVDPTPAAHSWTVSSPPPPPSSVTPPPARGCKVPPLAGKTLGQAKAALSAAGCTLGKVTKPKAKKGKKLLALVVRSSTPAANASTSGAVDLSLGPKPKKKPKKPRR